MRLYPLPGHVENTAYPSVAENCDFSAMDGSVKGVSELVTVVSVSGTPRGMCYYKDRWYFVQGDKLYSWQSGSPVQLASGIPGTDRAHFVPLSDHLVVRVADRIYTVVGNTATLVSVLNAPNIPTRQRQAFMFQLDVDHGGSATYSVSGDNFTLADVADSEPGAHRFIGSSDIANGPKAVGEIWVLLHSWQNTISLNHPISFEMYRNINVPANREAISGTLVELPYPYAVGIHRIRGRIELTAQTGFRFHIRHSTTWRRYAWAKNLITPTHYALTTVSSGVESQPVYFEVNTTNSGGTETENWYVHFTNLPSGTWRLYRRDSAGVYRLVHEGTGTSYTDYKLDSELGMRLVPNNPPTSGSYAIGWNRRCVIAQGSKLYISDAGRYRFTDDSEIVDVDDTIIGLAVIRGTLYYATQNGWFALYGWGVNLTTAQVYAEPPPVGYVGDALALRSGGCLLPGEPPDRRNTPRLSKSLHLGTRKYWLATTGALYVWYAEQNKWTRLNDNAADVVYHEGEVYIQTNAGIRRYAGTQRGVLLEFTIPLESPAQYYAGRVEGNGSGTLEIRNAQNTWRSKSGAFPLESDRIDHRYYELPLRITTTAGGAVHRLLLRLEPREQLERR